MAKQNKMEDRVEVIGRALSTETSEENGSPKIDSSKHTAKTGSETLNMCLGPKSTLPAPSNPKNTQENGQGSSTDAATDSKPTTRPESLHQTPSPTLSSPTSSRYVERTYEELSRMESPDWAKIYTPGKLGELGLQVENFDIEVYKPEMESREFHPPPGPGYKRNANGHKVRKPSCEEVLYIMLARVPGNRMRTTLLRHMLVEYERKTGGGRETGLNTVRQTLVKKDTFYKIVEGSKDECWWRLADVTEVHSKASGGRKKKARTSYGDERGDKGEKVGPKASPGSLTRRLRRLRSLFGKRKRKLARRAETSTRPSSRAKVSRDPGGLEKKTSKLRPQDLQIENMADSENIEKSAEQPKFSRSYLSLTKEKILKKFYTGSTGSGRTLAPIQDGPLYIQGEMPPRTHGATSWTEKFQEAFEKDRLHGK
ncbi:hypothetical protein BDZ45DRAFT_789745 [Acephala macrosclerotiorum]|nr:hypothetical protein BDZ45DRAFT_789745 [Acephala macrosclerotiorum]